MKTLLHYNDSGCHQGRRLCWAAEQEGRSTDAENRAVPLAGAATQDAIRAATTAEALYAAIGVDSWAVVPIASAWRPGHALEGTRLTLVRARAPGCHRVW